MFREFIEVMEQHTDYVIEMEDVMLNHETEPVV